MLSLGKILLYIVCVFLSGALAAPQAWWIVQHLPADWLHGMIGEVQRMPFHRYLSRSIQIAAIVLLLPLLKSLDVCSPEELGLFRNQRSMRDFFTGIASGLPSAMLLLATFFISGAFEIHSKWAPLILPKILLSAVVVAVLEEFLFRGVILGFLRQFLGRWIAIIFSAVIFAGLHFLNLPSTGNEKFHPVWSSGLASLLSIREGLPPWPILAWAFATLFLAGIILAWMTTRTGSLWASIGLHGSWVLMQQLFNSMASYRHLAANAFLPYVGPSQCHGAVPIGLDALFALLLAGVIAMTLLKNRNYS